MIAIICNSGTNDSRGLNVIFSFLEKGHDSHIVQFNCSMRLKSESVLCVYHNLVFESYSE